MAEVADPRVVLEAMTREQEPVLRNLLELYVHDFSELVACRLKPNGRFDLPVDELWWTGREHFPFLVRHGDDLAGFALARRGSRVGSDAAVMDVAEFFVVRGARRKGVGTAAAHALFARFPARWELRIRRANPEARRFWVRAAAAWLGEEPPVTPFIAKGVEWDVVRLSTEIAARAPSR